MTPKTKLPINLSKNFFLPKKNTCLIILIKKQHIWVSLKNKFVSRMNRLNWDGKHLIWFKLFPNRMRRFHFNCAIKINKEILKYIKYTYSLQNISLIFEMSSHFYTTFFPSRQGYQKYPFLSIENYFFLYENKENKSQSFVSTNLSGN